eukprot:s202_g22.t1
MFWWHTPVSDSLEAMDSAQFTARTFRPCFPPKIRGFSAAALALDELHRADSTQEEDGGHHQGMDCQPAEAASAAPAASTTKLNELNDDQRMKLRQMLIAALGDEASPVAPATSSSASSAARAVPISPVSDDNEDGVAITAAKKKGDAAVADAKNESDAASTDPKKEKGDLARLWYNQRWIADSSNEREVQLRKQKDFKNQREIARKVRKGLYKKQ